MIRIVISGVLIFIFTITPALRAEEGSAIAISIPLSYPQKSNAPRKQLPKIQASSVVKGEVFITIEGLNSQQQTSKTVYVEYFIGGDLLYSSQDKESLGFTFDTRAYPNGYYEIIANLWDTVGPSAIGKVKIEIRNY